MDGYGPGTYGDGFAAVYDDWYRDVSDAAATVAAIDTWAGADRRPIVELGVGTGRLAGPLARLGRSVIGIDASLAMITRLTPSDRNARAASS